MFVDIDPATLNIDASQIEAAITNDTSAILATHVYGNPCDVEKIEKIAQKHGLKVIYDGAHAFGVQIKGRSVFDYGDISICSLHATKLYHSIEGGVIFTKDPDLLKKLASMRNFGFDGPEAFSELGINAKNSEFHAAMGLVNLEYIDEIHNRRKEITERYDEKLKNYHAYKPVWHKDAGLNYAYYPILVESEELLLRCIESLKLNEIFTRRYFYPSLAKVLPYVDHVSMPVTDDLSKRVMCLPLYHDLTLEEVDLISRLLLRIQNN